MNITEEVKKFVEEECKKPTARCPEAFEFHFVPVVKYSLILAEKLNADKEIVEISAWLHDIGSIIYKRENHHITSCEIAEKKLQELNYPSDKIEKIKHCIISHRGSKNIKRETIEAEILAEADALSHFDDLPGLFQTCYIYENVKSRIDAKNSIRTKLINSYNKLSENSKKIIKPKFDAAMLLLE